MCGCHNVAFSSCFFSLSNETVSVFMFDYLSTIISYSLVGVAIFSGMYDGYTQVELASAVSKVMIMLVTGRKQAV